MANLSKVVNHLQAERDRVAKELQRLDEAIAVLGKLNGRGGRRGARGGVRRRLSPAARRRIAQAQKERWAKWKQQQKKAGKAA